MTLKVGEYVVFVSNSLDPDKTQSYEKIKLAFNIAEVRYTCTLYMYPCYVKQRKFLFNMARVILDMHS